MERSRTVFLLKVGFLVLVGAVFVLSPFLPLPDDVTRMVALVTFGMMSGAWITLLLDVVHTKYVERIGR